MLVRFFPAKKSLKKFLTASSRAMIRFVVADADWIPAHGFEASAEIVLPPLATVYFEFQPDTLTR